MDSVDLDVVDLDIYVQDNEVDILIIDQIDKLKIRGKWSNETSRLKAVYVSAREIAKRNSIAIIGITQAGAEAHGKLHFGYEALDNSKTGKAGEADFILCIGMEAIEPNEGIDSGYRVINIAKNKSPEGNKLCINAQLIFDYSRLEQA